MLEQSDPVSERPQPPRSPSLVPRDKDCDGPEYQRHDVVNREIWSVDYRIEHEHHGKHRRIEQVSREKEAQHSHKTLQYPDLHLLEQMILTSRILFQKAQFSQLFKMVQGNAGTAQSQRPLDRPDTDRLLP